MDTRHDRPKTGTQADYTYQQMDACYTELAKELQNGRLFRLLTKINMIVERPQPDNPTADSWSETGDRFRASPAPLLSTPSPEPATR